MKSSSTSLCLTASFATLFSPVKGSSDSSDPRFNPSDVSQYLFAQVSVDPLQDSINLSSETESLMFYSDSEEQTDDSTSSIVSSSLLYDGGCLVSSQALMCNGGDLFMENMPSQHTFFDSEYENDSDDDDDDDDDGHSSMLSNASVRRSRVSTSGVPTNAGSKDRVASKEVPPSPTTLPAGHGKFAFIAKNSALAIRGGTASDMGSTFAKKLLVAAIVTLAYEAVLGHFFEFLKVVMQTSPPGTSYASVIKTITQEKGIIGVWDGFVPWGVVQAVFKGGVFGLAFAVASSILMPLADEGKLPKQLALTLAGGIAGGFQGYVLSPTLLLKTRVMTNPIFREKMSLLKTTLQSFRIGFDVVADEGIAALMKGSNVFAIKRVFDWSTRYFFADIIASIMRERKKGEELTTGEKVTADLLAGLFSTLVTLPLDVMVSKTQDAKKAGISVSALTLFRQELDELGWDVASVYMSGFTARLAHVCCTTVVMKTGTGIVYDALFGKSKKQ